MLLVQEYLLSHTFADLEREHGVSVSFDKSGRKGSFNYSQIDTKDNDLLAQQCRGLILHMEDGKSYLSEAVLKNNKPDYSHICPGKTEICAYPFDRFFNEAQGSAAKINYQDPSLSVMEKLDGTLTIVYFDKYSDQWCVATRSVSEADIPLDNGLYTFRTLFEKAVKETLNMSFDEFTTHLYPAFTYCFELTSPYNTVIVRYPNCKITLLTIRSNLDLKEINLETFPFISKELKNLKVKTFNLNLINDIIKYVSEQNPLEMEGVVIKDSQFNRIKVKNPLYVAFHKSKDSLGHSRRNRLELILSEKDDDVIAAMPEDIASDMILMKEKVRQLIINYDQNYDQIINELPLESSKKDFALKIQSNKYLWQAPMFSRFDKKSLSMKDFIVKNKKDGTYSDSFLDKILELLT